MATDKPSRKEQLNDLDSTAVPADEADAVKGGAGGTSGGTLAPAPILKPISPKTIIPCV